MTKRIKTQAASEGITSVTRRDLLMASAAAAATLTAARLLLPSGAYAATAAPEVTGAKLGFIALTDAAPLIIAKEKGLFAKYGDARRRGAQAGLLGCDARQSRARRRSQRHRRRAHPDAACPT